MKHFLIILAFTALHAWAGTSATSVVVSDAWVRPTVNNEKTTDLYITLTALDGEAILLGGHSKTAGQMTMQQEYFDGNIKKWKSVHAGLKLYPLEKNYSAKGYRFLLSSLNGPLHEKTAVKIKLYFSDDKKIQGDFEIDVPVIMPDAYGYAPSPLKVKKNIDWEGQKINLTPQSNSSISNENSEKLKIMQAKCDLLMARKGPYLQQINSLNSLYGQEIEATRQQALSAFLRGAGGRRYGELSGGAQASEPYVERERQLAAERDRKVNEMQFELTKLDAQYKECMTGQPAVTPLPPVSIDVPPVQRLSPPQIQNGASQAPTAPPMGQQMNKCQQDGGSLTCLNRPSGPQMPRQGMTPYQ